jgi:hypothetical protein
MGINPPKLIRSYMQTNLKETLDEIWNEAYEIYADMEDLNDEELLECRLAIRGRAKALMRLSEKGQYYE